MEPWAVVGVGFVVFFLVLYPLLQVIQARRFVLKFGGRISKFRWQPFIAMNHEMNTRRWRVNFFNREGRQMTGLVQTSLFTGVKWVEGPRPDAAAEYSEVKARSGAGRP